MTYDPYPDLRFTSDQLMLDQTETVEVAEWIFSSSVPAEQITDKDRAFVQRALLITIDLSEKSSALFDVFASFVSKAPSRSVIKIVGNLAQRTAKRWFKEYLDSSPKISATGRSGFLYKSNMPMEWRVRVNLGDPGMLSNYLLHDQSP